MASGPPSAPLRALIVEDEAVVTQMLVNVLGHIGIPVARAVATTSEAMAVLTDDQGIDIALVDINLDVAGGGVEVAKAAAARGLYVVIITGNPQVPGDLAGHALLLKPFSVDHLEAILKDARRKLRP
ncbi:MAG: response regulator [Alphaproteobacteria bacterium]|nr:response regulator [Alphaproteobacteria bacterium]